MDTQTDWFREAYVFLALNPTEMNTNMNRTEMNCGQNPSNPICIHHHDLLIQDKQTLLGLIKSCRTHQDLPKARSIHSQMMRICSFLDDLHINNALLSMYARCGAFEEAKKVFDELPRRDVLAWNVLISCYAKLKRYNEALIFYKLMKDEGISPDSFTFVCILKVCSTMGLIEMGEEIHADVKKINCNLVKENIVLATALVNMYAKCGEVEKAKDVFDEILCRDVVSWSAMIGGYARNGLGIEALKCFRRMQNEGLVPDVITFVCLLKACGSIGYLNNMEACGRSIWPLETEASGSTGSLDMEARGRRAWVPEMKASRSIGSLEMGEEIHAEVCRQGILDKNIVLGTAIVGMYAKHGAMVKAQNVFDTLLVQNVITWNSLITGYVQCGSGDEALKCFRQMQDEGIRPNAVTFICVVKACASIQSLEKGEMIHDEIGKWGLLENLDVVLGTALVDMYAKCGALVKAQEVFDKLLERNVITWNALVAGYAQHDLGHEVLKHFEKMQSEGISPNAVTLVCILKACGSTGFVEMGGEIHAKLKNSGFYLEENTVLETALLDMYAKCGNMGKAQEVFDGIQTRNVVSWNALIAGYVQNKLDDEALHCFQQMYVEGFVPEVITFISILKACGNRGSLDIGKKIHDEVNKLGLLGKDIVLGTAMMDMYVKCGLLVKSREVFCEIPVKNIEAWNSLIMGYAQLGQAKKVLHIFQKNIVDKGIMPNLVTFILAISACSHAGLVEEGQMVFDDMENVFCLAPTLEHYGCMIDLFGRAGHLDKAVIVIEKVSCFERLPLWLGLLGACGKWSNVELGKWAYDRSMEMDDKCSAAHVCMGNTYASAGMYGEAEMMNVGD